MAEKRNNKNTTQLKIAIVAVSLILVLLILILLSRNKNVTSPTSLEKANIEYLEQQNEERVADLSGRTEQERMQYYCANFFKLIDSNQYEEAYQLLYSDYKENYFPTLNNFKKYFKEYFPEDFGLSYTNIERLGDIYVLNVNVSDTVNGSYGHNFSLYVVIKENALNDYVISFSRNSAVGEEE